MKMLTMQEWLMMMMMMMPLLKKQKQKKWRWMLICVWHQHRTKRLTVVGVLPLQWQLMYEVENAWADRHCWQRPVDSGSGTACRLRSDWRRCRDDRAAPTAAVHEVASAPFWSRRMARTVAVEAVADRAHRRMGDIACRCEVDDAEHGGAGGGTGGADGASTTTRDDGYRGRR